MYRRSSDWTIFDAAEDLSESERPPQGNRTEEKARKEKEEVAQSSYSCSIHHLLRTLRKKKEIRHLEYNGKLVHSDSFCTVISELAKVLETRVLETG